MVNMPHCRFENTLMALQECHEDLKEGVRITQAEELTAKNKLLELCEKITKEFKKW